jgi:hypothetical protein
METEGMYRQKVKRKQKENDRKEEGKTQKLKGKKKYADNNKLEQHRNKESWETLDR